MRQFHRLQLRLHQQVFGGGESVWKTRNGENGPHFVCLAPCFEDQRRRRQQQQQQQRSLRRLLSIETHKDIGHSHHDATRVSGDDGGGGARPIFFQRSPPLWLLSPSSSSSSSSNNSKVPLLTPYDLKGSTSGLPPSLWHASPCLGAALASSPIVGNLMRLYQNNHDDEDDDQIDDCDGGPRNDHHDDNDATVSVAEQVEDTIMQWQLHQASSLAHRMFFRLLRESPIHLVRNKSWPASYLTPAMVGSFLAEYYHNQRGLWCSSLSSSNNVQELNKEEETDFKKEKEFQ